MVSSARREVWKERRLEIRGRLSIQYFRYWFKMEDYSYIKVWGNSRTLKDPYKVS